MKPSVRTLFLLCFVISGGVLATAAGPSDADKTSPDRQNAEQGRNVKRVSLEAARERARLLHETMHGTLQMIHRQYYREDEGLPIPSRVMEPVFEQLSRRWNVSFAWLAVNAQAMDIDHEPQNEFQKNAAKALAAGEDQFELVKDGIYRRAGAITLESQCLKCHLPNRTSTKARLAGLIISMPVERN